eukprot:467654_1
MDIDRKYQYRQIKKRQNFDNIYYNISQLKSNVPHPLISCSTIQISQLVQGNETNPTAQLTVCICNFLFVIFYLSTSLSVFINAILSLMGICLINFCFKFYG